MLERNTFPIQIETKHIVVLVITLLVIPLLWGMGTFRIPIGSLFPGLLRPSFWAFLSSVVFLEWVALGLIYWITRPNTAAYLGIKVSFLRKYKFHLIAVFLMLGVLAAVAPTYLYNTELPVKSLVLRSLGPVSSVERVAFVFLSLTAGICEEVIFRGYGISVLERLFGKKWIALVLSSLAFMSLHGIAFIPVSLMIQYFIIGLIFGFFYQRFRRLDILIIIHFLIDALIAVLVP